MKLGRLALAAALAAILASPAWAVDSTFYVDAATGQDGTGGHDGTTAALAWRSLLYAGTAVPRANTANGNVVVYVAPGVYDTWASPALEAANGKRYYFVGDPLNPAGVQILSNATVSQTYVSVRGVTFAAALTVTGTADSVVKCRVGGALTVDQCRNAVISQNTLNGLRVQLGGTGTGAWQGLKNPTFEYNAMPALGTSPESPYEPFRILRCDTIMVHRNTATVTLTPATFQAGVATARELRYVLKPTLKYNRWTVVDNSGYPRMGALAIQDSTRNGAMKVDTILCVAGTNARSVVFFSAAGAAPNTVRGWVIDSNFVKVKGSVEFASGVQTLNFNYNCVYATGPALAIERGMSGTPATIAGKNHIEHNTLVGNTPDDAFAFPGAVSVSADVWVDSLYFTNNIVRHEAPYLAPDAPDRPAPSLRYAAMFDWAKADSAYTAGGGVDNGARADGNVHTGHLRAYRNLYDYHGFSVVPGDRALAWYSNVSGWQNSRPGIDATYGTYFIDFDEDSVSVWGSSSLVDSTLASWDPALRVFSEAKANGSGGLDIGARTYVGTPLAALVPTSAHVASNVTGTLTFSISNAGDGTLTVSSISSGDPAFTVSPTSASVAAGATQVVTVTYTATTRHIGEAVIAVVTDAGTRQFVISVDQFDID